MPIFNKKLVFGVLAFVLLAGGTAAGVYLVKRSQDFREKAAPATTLRFSPPSQSKSPGDPFDFSVQINTGGAGAANSVTGYKVEITYNPQAVEVTAVAKGSFAAPLSQSVPNVDQIDAANGKIVANAYTLDTGAAASGEGDLLRVTGRVKPSATAGQYNFEFTGGTEVVGIGEQGANLLTDTSSGSIIVLAAGIPSPSPSPSPSAAPASASPSPSPSPSPSAAPAAPAAPGASPSPSPSPATGGAANPSPSPSPSASPIASASPAAGGAASPAASASPSSSSKPTVSLPTNKTVSAGTTITGTAKANSTVTITVQSDPITATVKADSAGKWSYTLPGTLAAGMHTITVTDSNGTYSTSFTVSGTKGGVLTPSGETPTAGFSLPTYLALAGGLLLVIFGALLAF